MGYRSCVNGEIASVEGKFQELLALLREHGFVLCNGYDRQILMDKKNCSTGLEIEGETLKGRGEFFSAYGFNAQLIAVFDDAIRRGLIEKLHLERSGAEVGDHERYSLCDSILHKEINFVVVVPYDREKEVREQFELIRDALVSGKAA